MSNQYTQLLILKGPRPRNRKESDKSNACHGRYRARPNTTGLISFSGHKNIRTLGICLDYCKLRAVTVGLVSQRSFRYRTVIAGIKMSRSTRSIEIKQLLSPITHSSISPQGFLKLENEPETVQQAADALVRNIKGQFALVSLGDIVVFLKTQDEHIDHRK